MNGTDLSDAQMLVLAAVNEHGPCGPGTIGGAVWGTAYRQPQSYARTAGKILRQLAARNLVAYTSSLDSWGWQITLHGRNVLEIAAKHLGRT